MIEMMVNVYTQSSLRGCAATSCTAVGVGVRNNYSNRRNPANKLCLDCHSPDSGNGPRTATLAEHTHHKDASTGSECIACHMPKIEVTIPGVFVRSHTFAFIPPAMTDKYKIPNPCTSCHTDKSTAWAADAMRHWPERSPWRAE